MSIFSSIGHWFKNLFQHFRPGLDGFLQKYKDMALDEVKELAQINSNKEFHEWKDQAWAAINAQLAADGKKIAGNWISILSHLCFEEIKGKLTEKEKS